MADENSLVMRRLLVIHDGTPSEPAWSNFVKNPQINKAVSIAPGAMVVFTTLTVNEVAGYLLNAYITPTYGTGIVMEYKVLGGRVQKSTDQYIQFPLKWYVEISKGTTTTPPVVRGSWEPGLPPELNAELPPEVLEQLFGKAPAWNIPPGSKQAKDSNGETWFLRLIETASFHG